MTEKTEKKSTDVKVRLKNVRLSFAALFEPEAFTDASGKTKKRYKANFLIPKSDKKQLDLINDAIDQVIEEKWGKHPPKLKSHQLCLRDGDEESWDGYADHEYVSSGNTRPVVVVDRDGKTVLTEDDGRPYSGCYVNATITLWAQDNDGDKGGKRVNASLKAVQFVKNGEAFGAAPINPEEEFEDLGDDDDGDEPPRAARGGRSRGDDEDERPARRSARNEDERPARRSRDDDERPARRSRDADDDDIL